MPARGTLAGALLPDVEPHVRWYTGRVSAGFAPTASTLVQDLWQALEVEWDEGTPSKWPCCVSPWQVHGSQTRPSNPSLPPLSHPTLHEECPMHILVVPHRGQD